MLSKVAVHGLETTQRDLFLRQHQYLLCQVVHPVVRVGLFILVNDIVPKQLKVEDAIQVGWSELLQCCSVLRVNLLVYVTISTWPFLNFLSKVIVFKLVPI